MTRMTRDTAWEYLHAAFKALRSTYGMDRVAEDREAVAALIYCNRFIMLGERLLDEQRHGQRTDRVHAQWITPGNDERVSKIAARIQWEAEMARFKERRDEARRALDLWDALIEAHELDEPVDVLAEKPAEKGE